MTIVEQLVSVQADLEAKTKSLTEADATIKAGVELIEKATKECGEVKATLASIEAKHQEELKKVQDELVSVKADLSTVKVALDEANKKLENPAFLQVVKGDSKAVTEGNGASDKVVMTFEQAHTEYKKLNDPKAKELFRAEHAVELRLI